MLLKVTPISYLFFNALHSFLNSFKQAKYLALERLLILVLKSIHVFFWFPSDKFGSFAG
jgi:hypothetical protein